MNRRSSVPTAVLGVCDGVAIDAGDAAQAPSDRVGFAEEESSEVMKIICMTIKLRCGRSIRTSSRCGGGI